MTNSVSNSNIFLKEIILCQKIVILFSLSILFLFLSALPISAAEKEDTVSVNVFNNMYYGTLEKIMMVNLFFHYFLIKAIPHLRSLVIGPRP